MSGFDDIVNRANEARKRIREIPPHSVDELLAAGAVLLDVREEREYRAGHLAEAVHLNWNGLETSRVDRIVPDPSTPIVCYCTAGHRSAIAADTLQEFGYTGVRSIAGGLNAYRDRSSARRTA